MDYILILALIMGYLFSLVGMGIIIDEGFDDGRFTEKEYRVGMRWAMVPGVNTLLLFLNLFAWLTYRLSYGRK